MAANSFDKKCQIMADIWVSCRDEKARAKQNLEFGNFFELDEAAFDDWIEGNDLGLPLAYAVAEGIISITPTCQTMINETWQALLELLETEDGDYSTKESLFLSAGSEPVDD